MPERELELHDTTLTGTDGVQLPDGVRAAVRHRRRARRARVGAALASVGVVALVGVVLSRPGGGGAASDEFGPVRLAFDDPMLAALDGAGAGPNGAEREWSIGMVYRGDWPGGL